MVSVKTCCCGCSLRTGTQIILWVGVVIGALCIISAASASFQPHGSFSRAMPTFVIYIIFLGIHIMGLYGVEKEKPSYLIPYLTILGIAMALIIIYMVVTLFFSAVILSVLSIEFKDDKGHTLEISPLLIILIGEIINALLLGFIYYLFIVVLSFHNELKGQRQGTIPQYQY